MAIEQYLPKAPVLHRTVTGVDAADPTTEVEGTASRDRRSVRFDIDTSRCLYLTALTVQAMFWNSAAEKWFHGDSWAMDADDMAAASRPAIDVETRGAPAVYLKVRAATYNSGVLDLDIYATPW